MFSEKLISILKEAKTIMFFTGAGISAESGIPTFRGNDGIWNKLKPEELANFDAFMKNPDLVWEWYQHRRKIISETEPNDGHKAIAEFEKYYDTHVVTQNVDNLHRRAGSTNIYELHGNIERNYCIDCKKESYKVEIDTSGKVAKCEFCGGLMRPDVVWFGEMLPQQVFLDAEYYAAQSDVCFVVGTSGVVYPAAYIPITAKESNSFLVEVNIEKTELSSYTDESLIGSSSEILPKLLELVAK